MSVSASPWYSNYPDGSDVQGDVRESIRACRETVAGVRNKRYQPSNLYSPANFSHAGSSFIGLIRTHSSEIKGSEDLTADVNSLYWDILREAPPSNDGTKGASTVYKFAGCMRKHLDQSVGKTRNVCLRKWLVYGPDPFRSERGEKASQNAHSFLNDREMFKSLGAAAGSNAPTEEEVTKELADGQSEYKKLLRDLSIRETAQRVGRGPFPQLPLSVTDFIHAVSLSTTQRNTSPELKILKSHPKAKFFACSRSLK